MNKLTKPFALIALLLFYGGTYGLFAQESYNIYFGNIHAHTAYSDGSKDSLKSGVTTPTQAYAYARKSAHLDFLGISEHNHFHAGMKNKTNYALGLEQAKQATEDGRFVALYGMEYGVIENGGHVLIYGIDGLIGWEEGNYDIYNSKLDYSSLFKTIASRQGTFATLAHPDTKDFNNLKAQNYTLTADQAICGIAITTGQFDSGVTDYSTRRPLAFYGYYTSMLSKGYILGPTMDHDNHKTTFGRHSASRTAILAKSLTEANIIEAYRSNRFYATQDWNARVNFTINDETMGGYLKGITELDIKAVIEDYDPMDEAKSIELLYGIPGSGKPPKKLAAAAGDKLHFHFPLEAGRAFYFFLRITQLDGDIIVTSPIWAKN